MYNFLVATAVRRMRCVLSCDHAIGRCQRPRDEIDEWARVPKQGEANWLLRGTWRTRGESGAEPSTDFYAWSPHHIRPYFTVVFRHTHAIEADEAKSFTSSWLIFHYRRLLWISILDPWIFRLQPARFVWKSSYMHKGDSASARHAQYIVSKVCYAQTRNPAIANGSPVRRYTSILSWCCLLSVVYI